MTTITSIEISSDPIYLAFGATSVDVYALAARVRELCPDVDVRVLIGLGRAYRVVCDPDERGDLTTRVEQAYEEQWL